MICGHYMNDLVEGIKSVTFDNLEKFISRHVIDEKKFSKKMSSQMIYVDAKTYSLSVGGKSYPVAISDRLTPIGKFFAVEKWENPYWKNCNKAYTPSKDNPIGKYLVILADSFSLQKIACSIHMWPTLPLSDSEFKQGNFGTGCIRLSEKDMATLFHYIELGARIDIR